MASDRDSSPLAIFFKSLEEIESDLPAKITGGFEEIKKKLNEEKSQSLWLSPTKDSISLLDDLNDVLAECRILRLQRTSIKKKTFSFFRRAENRTREHIISSLSSIKEKIEKVESNASRNSTTTNFWTRQISSGDKADESNVPLYSEKKQEIVACLCREGVKTITIAIHGMCGSGKTALVDEVLKYPKVDGKFSPIIKICLSDMSPKEGGETKIVKHLLEMLENDFDKLTGNHRDDNPEDVLKKILDGRKFLIVLDDLWFCNGITKVLPDNTGGAVIVTSRIKDVAKEMVNGADEFLFHLRPCEENDKQLEDVVRKKVTDEKEVKELVFRIHGLPLAAKTLTGKSHRGLNSSR